MDYTRIVIFIYTFLLNYISLVMPLTTKRVVYQYYSIVGTEIVQCYSRCEKASLTLESSILSCSGRKLQLNCQRGHHIQIQVATKGKLNPDLDACNHKLDCSEYISEKLKTACDGHSKCTYWTTNETITKKCGKVKYLAVDIRYSCKPAPISTTVLTSPTRKDTVVSTAKTTLLKRKQTTTGNTTPKLQKTTKIGKPSQTHSLLLPTRPAPTPNDETLLLEKGSDDNNGMFWSMTAYTAISNGEFMRKNKTHLALALLLSMFVGMVLCLCFFLDYCRRAKKKKSKQVLESKLTLVQDLQSADCPDGVELIKPKTVEVIAMNGSLPRHKIISCSDNGYMNNNNEHEEDCEMYSASAPFFKRSLEHKSLIHNHMLPIQERAFSPTSLPAPPNHFLVESSSTSSNEFVPPPEDYNGDNDVTCSTIRVSTPAGSVANTLLSPQKSASHDPCNSELVEVEEVYLEEPALNGNLESPPYEYIEIGQYHASDEYSSSPHVPRSMTYHRTDNYVVAPKAKFASLPRRTTSNDETSQEESLIRTLDSKRLRKNNPRDRPGLQKSKSLDEPKKKTYFTMNNHHYLVRNPRKGRIHVMQRCDESLPRRGYNQKAIYSDNEASRRRRRYDVDYRRSCSCQQGLNDLYCKKCGKPDEPHLKCCSSLTSNGQSSHDGDNQGPLLSISNELIKNKQCCVEESGYQSHDTGTDSLCSSSFSTDQEDSRMFLPSSLNNGRQNGCRSKSCRIRGHTSKRDPRFIIVRDSNKSKVSRRIRHEDYNDTNAHIHDNNPTIDVHPYDSSMDDTSSRDSVKLFRRIRKQHMAECHPDDITNCNCMHELKPPDARGRMDGIETS